MRAMPDLVDQLVAHPGIYVGSDIDPTGGHGGDSAAAARLEVRPLPGGAGVSLDYECLRPDAGQVHAEHAVLARTPAGLVLMTAHSHAPVASVLPESEPGRFPAGDDAPFPMEIRIEVPEAGHVRYLWSYGMPGEQPQLRDEGDLRLIGA
jgi:hypothetical protein